MASSNPTNAAAAAQAPPTLEQQVYGNPRAGFTPISNQDQLLALTNIFLMNGTEWSGVAASDGHGRMPECFDARGRIVARFGRTLAFLPAGVLAASHVTRAQVVAKLSLTPAQKAVIRNAYPGDFP